MLTDGFIDAGTLFSGGFSHCSNCAMASRAVGNLCFCSLAVNSVVIL